MLGVVLKYTPEDLEQIKLVQFLFLLERQGKIEFFYSNVNELKSKSDNFQNMLMGKKLKEMGKRKGVADITILTRKKLIFIEIKRKREVLKSGKLSQRDLSSKEQKSFIKIVNKLSYATGKICYGFEEAKKFIEEWI